MAKKMYIGVNSIARKVKKQYLGVDSKARKVKKGYIGVGGKAQLFYTSEYGPPAYYGTAENLSTPRYNMACASVGNYALFASGERQGSTSANKKADNVEAYSKSLVKTIAPSLSSGGVWGANGVSVENYAVFFACYPGMILNYYDKNLVRGTNSAISGNLAGASSARVGNKSIFIGGGGSFYSQKVHAIDEDMVVVINENKLSWHSSFSVSSGGSDELAIFLCGNSVNNSNYSAISRHRFDKDLVYTCTAPFTPSCHCAKDCNQYGAFNGTHHVFSGYGAAILYACDDDLVGTTINISANFYNHSVQGGEGYVIIAGGGTNEEGSLANLRTTTGLLDKDLVYSEITGLSTPRINMSIARAGDYLICAGGSIVETVYCGAVEAYKFT